MFGRIRRVTRKQHSAEEKIRIVLATGYEQVRSIAAWLDGDIEAARRVELDLPTTGVCSSDLLEAPPRPAVPRRSPAAAALGDRSRPNQPSEPCSGFGLCVER